MIRRVEMLYSTGSMRFGIQLVLAAVSFFALFGLSLFESAYALSSEVSLHILRSESRPDRRELFLDELLEERDRFELALLLGIYTSVAGFAILVAQIFQREGVPKPLITGFLASAAVGFLFRTIVPRLLVQNAPERALMALIPLFRPYYRVAAFAVLPGVLLLRRVRKPESETQVSTELEEDIDATMSDIQAFLDLGAEEGIIEESEGVLIQSIVEFGDRVVAEVMTPRSQLVAIDESTTILQARDVMVSNKHSRLPIYRQEIDHIEGVLYVRDLIAAWADGKEHESVTTIMRPAYFIPEVKSVADLLEEMRKSNTQFALVIDEYGSVSGLVTIEDLLEEIVGEIEDEDVVEDHSELVTQEDGALVVKGATEIRKIEVHYDLELEADDFTTVAGLVVSELGHVPTPGERLMYRQLEFEVVDADDRRVNLVRLRRIVETTGDEQATVPNMA
jgi:putative hemolysin